MFKVVLGDGGQLPTRGSEESAGYDLRCAVDVKISPGRQVLVSTQVYAQIPIGWVGLIKPRSGLGLRKMVETKIGVIDSDYRGEIKVLLYNYGTETFTSKKGNKIAQMIIVPCMITHPIETNLISNTQRGAGGFGSTGK